MTTHLINGFGVIDFPCYGAVANRFRAALETTGELDRSLTLFSIPLSGDFAAELAAEVVNVGPKQTIGMPKQIPAISA